MSTTNKHKVNSSKKLSKRQKKQTTPKHVDSKTGVRLTGKQPHIGPVYQSSAVHRHILKHRTSYELLERKTIRNPLSSLTTHDLRVFEPLSEDSVSLTQSLVDPLTVYRFRLGGYTTLGRSAGVSNAFIAADPSASGWNSPEWSTLSALFSEFRLVSLSVRISKAYIATITNGIANLAVCSNLGTAVNPGSYAACADNADCNFYSYQDTSKSTGGSGSGYVHTMHATDLNYSQVTTPTVEPYAGAPGSIQFYADNGLASGSDTTVYQILISGIYDFRIRV